MTEFLDPSPENLELRYRLLQQQTIVDEARDLYLASQGINTREMRHRAHAITDEEFYRLCGNSAAELFRPLEIADESSAA